MLHILLFRLIALLLLLLCYTPLVCPLPFLTMDQASSTAPSSPGHKPTSSLSNTFSSHQRSASANASTTSSTAPFANPGSVSKARTSVRYSTYSVAPSFAPSVHTTDSVTAEIRDIASGLDRMENKALSSQRVLLSEEKTDAMGKLALGAKLERALDRRMSSQDAEMRPRGATLAEKRMGDKINDTLNEKVG